MQELERLSLKLGKLHNITVLKVMYGLYGLTAGASGFYTGSSAIAEESGLSTEETEAALEQLPVAVKEENQMRLYRLESSFYPLPPLLSFLDSGEYSPFLAIIQQNNCGIEEGRP